MLYVLSLSKPIIEQINGFKHDQVLELSFDDDAERPRHLECLQRKLVKEGVLVPEKKKEEAKKAI